MRTGSPAETFVSHDKGAHCVWENKTLLLFDGPSGGYDDEPVIQLQAVVWGVLFIVSGRDDYGMGAVILSARGTSDTRNRYRKLEGGFTV